MTYFDAWDYENAMNSQLLSSIFNQWWFVKDKDFVCYNTEQMISNDMANEWIEGSYLGSNGVLIPQTERVYLKTDFVQIENQWYYFDEEGNPLKGWHEIEGEYYYFDLEDGHRLEDTVVDGYYLDTEGVCHIEK